MRWRGEAIEPTIFTTPLFHQTFAQDSGELCTLEISVRGEETQGLTEHYSNHATYSAS